MSNTRTSLPASITRLILLGVALALAATALFASAAGAATVSGRGVGYFSPSDGGFWLGSWQLDDGHLAFCVNTERGTPNGGTFTPHDGSGWYSPEDAAKLAYISRTWASANDPATAAAGQMATWAITGLGRYTLDEYAAKAGGDAARVLSIAHEMIDQTAAEASRGVTARLDLSAVPGAGASVQADLVVDYLSRGSTILPTGKHAGVVTLHGATFADGTTTRQMVNGERQPIVQTGADAVTTVSATVSFDSLPYGAALRMGESTSGAQNLLIASPSTTLATSFIETTRPSALPFQPIVSTTTSAAEAAPGSAVHDILTLSAAPTDGATTEWGVYGPAGGPFAPIPVTVRSSLLGPFAEPIVEAATPPTDAPVVCEVELVVTTGPGEYTTPECILPAEGYYVWVERIDATDTPPEQGGDRILPWASRFGVATEVTFVPAPPAPPTEPPAPPAVAVPPRLAETGADPSAALAIAALTMAGLGGLLLGYLQLSRSQQRLRSSRSGRS